MQISGELLRVLEFESRIELETIGGKGPNAALLRGQTVKAFRNTARFCDQDCWI